jgi:hypothetical protein
MAATTPRIGGPPVFVQQLHRSSSSPSASLMMLAVWVGPLFDE